MQNPTKQCPYCAETIQAAAIVCRYCGRDLAGQPAAPAVHADRDMITQAVADYTRRGWRIVSQTDTSAQVAEPKKLNPLGMALFVILPGLVGCLALLAAPGIGVIILAVAAIGLVLVLIDYAVKKERLDFITVEKVRQQLATQERAAGRARIRRAMDGYVCGACGGAVRPDATACEHCKATFSLT